MDTLRKLIPLLLLLISSAFFLSGSIRVKPEDMSEIMYKGRNVVITQADIDASMKEAEYFESKLSYEEAATALIIYEALYQKAMKAGFSVTDEELGERIEQEKEHLDGINTDEKFKRMLANRGMTSEEYWEAYFSDRKYHRNAVINKYLADYQAKLIAENKLMSKTAPFNTSTNTDWQGFVGELRIEAVEEEEIISTQSGKRVHLELWNEYI